MFRAGALAVVFMSLGGVPCFADELFYAVGSSGKGADNLRKTIEPWEKRTGHKVTLVLMPASSSEQFSRYRLWLAAGTSEIDIYQTDIVWAPQFADYFVDMKDAAADLAAQHFPQVIESQTVNGRLVALPLFADAPALYYRKDLLEKYGRPVPETWQELAETARVVQDGERAAGNARMWGYVWQGGAYECLTCNGLEWISSHSGGRIIEADGVISVNNERAVKALEMAVSWIGAISPRGVLAYKEEDARGIWQTGNAVFMRNWSYNYGLSSAQGSAVRGRFGVARLPAGDLAAGSASTLGGWNVAVSKFSTKRKAAVSLALYLASAEGQKRFALLNTTLPTMSALYDDPEIITQTPMIPRWKDVILSAVPRPSAPVRDRYNEVSAKIWSAIHNILSGHSTAAAGLQLLEDDLVDLSGPGW